MTTNSDSATADEANKRNALQDEPTFLQFLQAFLREYARLPDAAARAAMATPEEVELARVWAPEIGAGRAEEPDSIQEAIGCAWFLHGTSDSHLLAAFHLFEAYEWGIYKKWETDNTGGESKNDPAPAAASDRANREHEEKGENHHG